MGEEGIQLKETIPEDGKDSVKGNDGAFKSALKHVISMGHWTPAPVIS